ncbi:MAG TPA: acyloxyacyl hydrolase [Stellaceae bacterium]|nr:acyloxyacyl hydrolase [Stellaceae bacterium]
MSLSTIGARVARAVVILAAVAVLCGVPALPAAAQITFGSPSDPPRLALGAGAFDITPSNHKDAQTAAEFRGEYRFGDVLSVIAPFVGVSATSDGAAYGYFGFGVDVNFGPNWVLTPNGAAGVFERGSGTKLGSWWEFRTGAELAYRFADSSRLGVAFNHTSNAGLTKRNPGEQSIALMYSIPMP